MNHCGNCANYVWGDQKTPLPSECITCTTTHVPKGEHPTPSHWKAKPQTNADRIRAMSDEELAAFLDDYEQLCEGRELTECIAKNCKECISEWLQQPAKENDNGR